MTKLRKYGDKKWAGLHFGRLKKKNSSGQLGHVIFFSKGDQ
jgi:hypothetical protein